MSDLGKFLVIFGLILVAAGVLLIFFNKIPFLGKLPGDIHIERENFHFFFPLTTSILISIVLTIIFWLINIFKK